MKKSSINLLYAFIGILTIAAIVIAILVFSSPNKALEGFSNGYSVEYFMMQSCPHCTRFNSTWENFEQAVQKNAVPVKLEKFDITGDGEKRAQKFKVNSAPTVIVTKNNEIVKEYDGPREVSAMLSFIKSLL